MRKVSVLAVTLGTIVMSSASAQEPAPAVAPATTPAAAPADDANAIVCHAGEPILGSRFPGPRVCHTRREWEQIKRDAQEVLIRQQMNRSCNAGTNGQC